MNKPNSLKTHLLAAVPELANNPDRLLVFIDNGSARSTVEAGLSFEYSYSLNVILTEFAGHPDAVFIPLLAWLMVNQHELLANQDKGKGGRRLRGRRTRQQQGRPVHQAAPHRARHRQEAGRRPARGDPPGRAAARTFPSGWQLAAVRRKHVARAMAEHRQRRPWRPGHAAPPSPWISSAPWKTGPAPFWRSLNRASAAGSTSPSATNCAAVSSSAWPPNATRTDRLMPSASRSNCAARPAASSDRCSPSCARPGTCACRAPGGYRHRLPGPRRPDCARPPGRPARPPERGQAEVQYERRELLGFTDTEIDMIRDDLLQHLVS